MLIAPEIHILLIAYGAISKFEIFYMAHVILLHMMILIGNYGPSFRFNQVIQLKSH